MDRFELWYGGRLIIQTPYEGLLLDEITKRRLGGVPIRIDRNDLQERLQASKGVLIIGIGKGVHDNRWRGWTVLWERKLSS